MNDQSSARHHDPSPAVIFEPLHDDVPLPTRTTDGSAGYDLRAYLKGRRVKTRCGSTAELGTTPVTDGSVTLEPQDIALIPTGFRACLPPGYEAQIRLRSSIAFRRGLIIPNAPATIDADYPDEWLVMVKNDSLQPVRIEHGERIAQAVLNRFEPLPWIPGTVQITTDRTGGLGSTGRT